MKYVEDHHASGGAGCKLSLQPNVEERSLAGLFLTIGVQNHSQTVLNRWVIYQALPAKTYMHLMVLSQTWAVADGETPCVWVL